MDKNSLPIIHRDIENIKTRQRLTDGYIEAISLCKSCDKNFKTYLKTKPAKEFINELSVRSGISCDDLIYVIDSGFSELLGTWVHPQIAINLSQWISPEIAVIISGWISEWASGQLPKYEETPQSEFDLAIQVALNYNPDKKHR